MRVGEGMATSHAALGFRIHTGWAAMVAVRGPVEAPLVLDRRRVELAESQMSAAVYHAAAKLSPSQAAKLVEETREDATKRARAAMAEVIAELAKQGHEVVAAGIVLGGGRLPEDLPSILASHAYIHSAEGELFREALRLAGEGCKLAVVGVPGSSIYERAAEGLGRSVAEVQDTIKQLGRAVGRPWAQDQKESALAASLALACGRGARPASRSATRGDHGGRTKPVRRSTR